MPIAYIDDKRGLCMLYRLVGQCHVGSTNKQVFQYVISKMKHGRKTWLAVSKEERKEVLRELIRLHKENRDLYNSVQSGKFSYGRS